MQLILIRHAQSAPDARLPEAAWPLSDEGKDQSRQLVVDLRERKLTNDMRADWQDLLEKSWTDFTFALPGCESSLDCQIRVSACIEKIVAASDGKTVALCSHGNAIALFLNSLDESFGYKGWESMKNPHVYRIELAISKQTLVSI